MSKRNWLESPEISGHFKVVNTDLPILHSKIGDIDFRKITLDQAQRLFDSGSRYIEKINRSKQPKANGKQKEL